MTLEAKKAQYLKTISKIEENLEIFQVSHQEIFESHTNNIKDWKEKLDNLSAVILDLDKILTSIDEKLKKYENSTLNANRQILKNKFELKSSPISKIKDFACTEINSIEIPSIAIASPTSSNSSYLGNMLSYLNPFNWLSSTSQPAQAASSATPVLQSASKPHQSATASSSAPEKWNVVKPESKGTRLRTGKEERKGREARLWTGEEARREEERKTASQERS